MKNRGFSLIELIIVITIMVILVGTIAPMLVKYINKSRLSSDVNQGREIAMAIMSVVVEEDVNVDAQECTSPKPLNSLNSSEQLFKDAICKHLSVKEITDIKGKSKKDADGNDFVNPQYYYTLDAAKNKVEVFYGDVTDSNKSDYQIYPVIGKKLVK